MIKTKVDLKRYLLADKKALGYESLSRPSLLGHDIWKFQIILRKLEYYTNNQSLYNTPIRLLYKYRYKKASFKLGFTVPINVFGAGLNIPHHGTIVVNSRSRVGENCRIHTSTNIGGTGDAVPIIGNDVYIGPGAKIFGGITIADGVSIGANSVVNKSVTEKGATVAGVPAKIINKRSFVDQQKEAIT
ncbi:serine O-acetyltransferase [Shouchella clausii]|uniref:serine O-acetyltransferase n=1 Tax=Shouchella clausii TaxID=79880 RepID=UPI00165303DF|nr:serine acetyltransferase [Shouchella clausii]QNM43761.1 serine acetyltransferase [Shouchella clausii]